MLARSDATPALLVPSGYRISSQPFAVYVRVACLKRTEGLLTYLVTHISRGL